MKKHKKIVINIMGPTASGKTDLAVALCDHLPADLISVDSAMVYRGMDIGTAKPTAQELEKAPHRLIDISDPIDTYSAGNFCEDAIGEIQSIHASARIPILVGGTMLYFNKLLLGMADLPVADQAVRDTLSAQAARIGWLAMHDRLKTVDPVAAGKIKPQDPQRIQRALEVYELTGKPISSFHAKNHHGYLSAYNVINIALIPLDRAWLHARIAKRFDIMLAAGFLDEARQFFDDPKITADLPAMRMVGYRQAFEYFSGNIDLNEMRDRAIAATRQLAKRQLTWLRGWEDVHRFDPCQEGLVSSVLELLCSH